MEDKAYVDKSTMLRISSIVEDAPYLVEGESKVDAKCISMYSLKCASCQSQNCTSTKSLEKRV